MADIPAPGTSRGAVSRRALLAAGAGLVATGCSVENPVSRDEAPKRPVALAPDVTVATRALDEITAVRVAATRTVSRYPSTHRDLAPLVRMHRAHEASLADAVPDRAQPSQPPAPYAVPRQRQQALDRLARREQRLHDTLDALALRAQSGEFARLLASMGSGVAQRLAGWPA